MPGFYGLKILWILWVLCIFCGNIEFAIARAVAPYNGWPIEFLDPAILWIPWIENSMDAIGPIV